ncbi:MAG: hypothetical protein HGA45_25095 [Chloroflexales bacterium]|nr:hypothetical protein [Chloroflexales bacterium]
MEHPEPGEIIFADGARKVHARRWTFRQSKHSTVSDTTRRALIVSEGLHASAAADVAALLDTLEAELREAGFPPSRRAILTAEAPRWDRFAGSASIVERTGVSSAKAARGAKG